VGVQWHGRVQRLESCEQDDQDEDKVEIKTNSDFQSKSNFQKKNYFNKNESRSDRKMTIKLFVRNRKITPLYFNHRTATGS
jgi:hypothetical protein